MKPFRAILIMLSLLPLTQLLADEGRIPIYQAGSITAPGHYVLTRDIAVTGGVAIQIQGSNITLDLNGHTISSPMVMPYADIIGVDAASSEVTIRNGHLVGGRIGINSLGTSIHVDSLEITDTRLSGIYIQGAAFAEVRSCTLTRACNSTADCAGGSGSLFVDSSYGRILRNAVSSTSGPGIGISGFRGGEISHNEVRDYGGPPSGNGAGIKMDTSQGVLAQDNTLTNSYGQGIVVSGSGNTLRGNTVTLNEEGGIWIGGDHNLITDNALTSNGDYGDGPWGILVTGSRNMIRGNKITDTRGDGIWVGSGSYNVIDSNFISSPVGQGFCGITFTNSGGHVYRSNILSGSGPAGPVCGPSNTDAGGNVL